MILKLSDHHSGGDLWDDAFASALFRLPTTGGVIELPGETIHVGSTVLDRDRHNIWVRGEGDVSRIEIDTIDQSVFCVGQGITGWRFSDLSLYGTGYGGDLVAPIPGGCGIACDGARDIQIFRTRIERFRKCVYLRRACQHCDINHNQLLDSNNAINEDNWGSAPDGVVKGNIFAHNTSINCRAHVILDNRSPDGVVRGTGMRITGNYFEGHNGVSTERYGIRVYDARGAVVADNVLTQIECGIELMRGASYNSVTDNTITDHVSGIYYQYGIWIHREPLAPNDYPTGNTVLGNAQDGTAEQNIVVEEGIEGNLVDVLIA